MKAALKYVLRTQPGWAAAAPLRAPGTYVLMYHRITGPGDFFPGVSLDNFRRQMRWIRTHCEPVWPGDVLRAARCAQRLKPPVVVTFDDGYRDFHDRAYPVLRELDIPAVVFLSTDFMDRGGVLWTERLEWAVLRTRRESLPRPWHPDRAFRLTDEWSRRAFAADARHHMKEATDEERRRWLDELLEAAGVEEPHEALGRQMLSWDEVRRCADGTCFGGHTHTHPILSRMSEEAMDLEIATCRERIAAETGRAPDCFAYPNGRADDFNEATRRSLARHGFDLAFSTIPGVNTVDTDTLALRRLHNWDSGAGELAALMLRAR
jgi:peptidoglycan/xylan/chitin deacetylase (PgdA/CDA1 family)